MIAAATLCRHCGRRVTGEWRRGLCPGCYYAPGVRERYPSTSRYASPRARGEDGLPERRHDLPLPEPTDACPGTPERQAVLEQRIRDGLQLWHPDDRADWEGTPAAGERREALAGSEEPATIGYPCVDCGARVCRDPERRCGGCARRAERLARRREQTMSEANGSVAADPVARPENRLRATDVLRDLLREMGPAAAYEAVARRAPWVGPQTYRRIYAEVHGQAAPRRTRWDAGPAGARRERPTAVPAQAPAPAEADPGPRPCPGPAPARTPAASAGRAAPAGTDLAAVIEHLAAVVAALGPDGARRGLEAAIALRGGAQ